MDAGAPLHRRQSAGMTLIEVLVALVVLSIGLLGMAILMTKTQQANDDAGLRTQAGILANSILDNMRANLVGAQAFNYNVTIGTAVTYPPSTSCIRTGTATTTCTAAQIATYDLSLWKYSLSKLPCGDGSVLVSVTGDFTNVKITVLWDAARANGVSITNCAAEMANYSTNPNIVTLTLQTNL